MRRTSEVVPAGRWELIAELPGGRRASVPVALVAGETTSVELAFAD